MQRNEKKTAKSEADRKFENSVGIYQEWKKNRSYWLDLFLSNKEIQITMTDAKTGKRETKNYKVESIQFPENDTEIRVKRLFENRWTAFLNQTISMQTNSSGVADGEAFEKYLKSVLNVSKVDPKTHKINLADIREDVKKLKEMKAMWIELFGSNNLQNFNNETTLDNLFANWIQFRDFAISSTSGIIADYQNIEPGKPGFAEHEAQKKAETNFVNDLTNFLGLPSAMELEHYELTEDKKNEIREIFRTKLQEKNAQKDSKQEVVEEINEPVPHVSKVEEIRPVENVKVIIPEILQPLFNAKEDDIEAILQGLQQIMDAKDTEVLKKQAEDSDFVADADFELTYLTHLLQNSELDQKIVLDLCTKCILVQSKMKDENDLVNPVGQFTAALSSIVIDQFLRKKYELKDSDMYQMSKNKKNAPLDLKDRYKKYVKERNEISNNAEASAYYILSGLDYILYGKISKPFNSIFEFYQKGLLETDQILQNKLNDLKIRNRPGRDDNKQMLLEAIIGDESKELKSYKNELITFNRMQKEYKDFNNKFKKSTDQLNLEISQYSEKEKALIKTSPNLYSEILLKQINAKGEELIELNQKKTQLKEELQLPQTKINEINLEIAKLNEKFENLCVEKNIGYISPTQNTLQKTQDQIVAEELLQQINTKVEELTQLQLKLEKESQLDQYKIKLAQVTELSSQEKRLSQEISLLTEEFEKVCAEPNLGYITYNNLSSMNLSSNKPKNQDLIEKMTKLINVKKAELNGLRQTKISQEQELQEQKQKVQSAFVNLKKEVDKRQFNEDTTLSDILGKVIVASNTYSSVEDKQNELIKIHNNFSSFIDESAKKLSTFKDSRGFFKKIKTRAADLPMLFSDNNKKPVTQKIILNVIHTWGGLYNVAMNKIKLLIGDNQQRPRNS